MSRGGVTSGFTLLEVVVVLLILGLLAALVAPAVLGRTDHARAAKAAADLATLEQALERYRLDAGSYPTTEQGLAALVAPPAVPPLPARWAAGGYLDGVPLADGVPLDPWGNAYVYFVTADGRIALRSFGADGLEGGSGAAADVDLERLP